jgi:hypothetical protein
LQICVVFNSKKLWPIQKSPVVRYIIQCYFLNNITFYLVYRIPPFFYLHVLDQNSNVTRLEVGPKTFVKQDHEKVLLGPERMLIIPYV